MTTLNRRASPDFLNCNHRSPHEAATGIAACIFGFWPYTTATKHDTERLGPPRPKGTVVEIESALIRALITRVRG